MSPTWWRPILTVAVFSVLPFAVFLNDNRDELDLDAGLALYVLIPLLPGLLAVALVDRLRGPVARERAAVVFATAAFVFFQFEFARSLVELLGASPEQDAPAVAAWVISFVLAIGLALWVSARPLSWNYALVAGALLLALPTVQYGWFKATESAPSLGGGGSGELAAAGERPDVYFFMLDGYGRADELEDAIGYDNSRFLAALRRRGFEVHESASAAYPMTFLSLASTLTMGYPAEAGPLEDHTPFYAAMSGDNDVVRAFEELGYRFVLATDYSSLGCGEQVDLCVEPSGEGIEVLIGEREWALLNSTPLGAVLPSFGLHPSPLKGYLSPEEVVGEVAAERPDAPVFVYSHLLTPHPPYRYGEGCELQRDLTDTSLELWGEADGAGGAGYRQALDCVNRSLLRSIARIRAADPHAIVVIQGDHGPKFGIHFHRPLDEWTRPQLQARFSIMSAARLPRGCSPNGARAELAVNTFRIVLDCITDGELGLLAPRYFMIDLVEGEVEAIDGYEPRPRPTAP